LYAAVVSETKLKAEESQFQDLYDLDIRLVSPDESEEVRTPWDWGNLRKKLRLFPSNSPRMVFCECFCF